MTQQDYPPDFRALCAELVEAWDDLPWEYDFKGNVTGIHGDLFDESAVDRARAALSQPEPQEPSDAELLELMPETMRDEFSYASKVCSDATGGKVEPGIFRVALNTAALEYAQAVLARYAS